MNKILLITFTVMGIIFSGLVIKSMFAPASTTVQKSVAPTKAPMPTRVITPTIAISPTVAPTTEPSQESSLNIEQSNASSVKINCDSFRDFALQRGHPANEVEEIINQCKEAQAGGFYEEWIVWLERRNDERKTALMNLPRPYMFTVNGSTYTCLNSGVDVFCD